MNETINQEIAQREGAQKAFQNYYAFLAAGAIDQLIEVWNEHGVDEFPFAPPGFPARLEGRLAIQAFSKALWRTSSSIGGWRYNSIQCPIQIP